MGRKKIRDWYRPFAGWVHQFQPVMRHLPEPVRTRLDQVGGLAPLPTLLIESSAPDLLDEMDEAEVRYAVVVAHPPYAPSEFVLEVCALNSRLIPAVNIPPGTSRPGLMLKKFAEKGVKILKIHPAADGEGPDSARYRALLKTAADHGMIVILHTGCLYTHVLFKDPDQGHAERYSGWFEKYPQTQFVLAHMNFHDPHIALDLCEEYPNLFVDTSWQPSEVIGEAVRRIGASRILFASDWPIVGNNFNIAKRRIDESRESGLITAQESELIFGENAVKLLGITPDAT